jgi:hypothetical protein
MRSNDTRVFLFPLLTVVTIFTKVTSVHWLVWLSERATYLPFLRIFANFLFKSLLFEKLVLLNATIHHVCVRLRAPGRRDDEILYCCAQYLCILSMEHDLVPKILRWS